MLWTRPDRNLCGQRMDRQCQNNIPSADQQGITSSLSFFQCVFYTVSKKFHLLVTFLSANTLDLDKSKILLFTKELNLYHTNASWNDHKNKALKKRLLSNLKKCLTHYQTTNFRLFQTERVCRRQFQIGRKWQKVNQTGRKHCGKRRNCSLRAISPFPTVFSKGLFPRGVNRRHCVGMGILLHNIFYLLENNFGHLTLYHTILAFNDS